MKNGVQYVLFEKANNGIREIHQWKQASLGLTYLYIDQAMQEIWGTNQERTKTANRPGRIKEGKDIFCSFYVPEAGKAVFTPIVNLKFIGDGPLFEKIKTFQAWDGIID